MDKRALSGLAALTLLDISAATAQETRNFAGTYVGILAGYRSANADLSAPAYVLTPSGDLAGPRNQSYSPNGAIIRGAIGFNLPIYTNFMWGIEGDIAYGKSDATKTTGLFTSDGVVTSSSRLELGWQGTLRARLGLVDGPAMYYVTVGGAVTDVTFSDQVSIPGFGSFSASKHTTATGIVVGAGSDFMLNGNPNLLGRIEYLYEDFGSMRVPLAGSASTAKMDLAAHKLNVGLIYKFDPQSYPEPAPAVAADWSGPYVGAGLGAFLGESRWTPRGPLTPFPDLPVSMDLDGTLLSGKLGYRLQANRWVFGVEADYARGGVDGSAPCVGNKTPVICTLKLRSQIKLTGQIGYASGPWLPYLSFGYAQASGRASVFDPVDGPALAGGGTHRGGLVGAGLDYRVSRAVSIGLEYQHIWYGSDAYALLPGSGPVTLGPSSTKITIDPDYVGINVKIRTDGN